MIKSYEHGWKFYHFSKTEKGKIGINSSKKTKWFPEDCPLNSSWITRKFAAELIKNEKAA